MAKKDLPPTSDLIVPPASTGKPLPVGRFGKGWLKDVIDPRDFSARAFLGAPSALGGEASVEAFVRRIRDQQQTSSCVGQSWSSAIDTRLRKMGFLDAGEPASLGVYTPARALERSNANSPLLDEGSFPRNAAKAVQQYGVPTEQAWPFSEKDVNTEIPWDVMQQMSQFRLVAWHRIDSQGLERCADVANAIKQGYPVCFATEVDQAFEDYMGKGLIQPAHASLGGHAMCLVGYRMNGVKFEFRGQNSWGTSWGDRGFYWASQDFVIDPRAGDFYIIQVSGV